MLGLGCNQIGRTVDRDGARRLIDECEASGVNLVDTADTYGEAGTSEEYLGDALAGTKTTRVVITIPRRLARQILAGLKQRRTAKLAMTRAASSAGGPAPSRVLKISLKR